MTYLIIEIVLCLIAAALLGLLAGWLLWRRHTPGTHAITAQREQDRERIQDLESQLAARPDSQEAEFAAARAVPPFAPIVPPVRTETPQEERTDPAPLAPQVFETEASVSELEPVPYEDDDFGRIDDLDHGDGPSEATFADDPPAPAPLPLAPEAERTSAPTYDDLKRISGIGPAIESQLAEIGVTTYRQIALFTDSDIERVGAHIDFFADRIRREGWVVQAAALHRQTYGTKP